MTSAIETALTELSANLRRMEQRHQATGYKFDRLYGLIDAAREELAADGWRPIDSAPKDGTWIYLWRTPETEISPVASNPQVIGRWSEEEAAFVWPDDEFYDPFTPHGKNRADHEVDSLRTFASDEFTHWKALSYPGSNS